MREDFKIKLKWNVYNKKFKNIQGFTYGVYKFTFNMDSQEMQEEFCGLLCNTDELDPLDICNFLLENSIKFKFKFVYIKEAGMRINYTLFKYFIFIKKELFKLHLKKINNSFKIVHSAEKRFNNGKQRRELMLQLINKNTRTIYYLLIDSNIWWKPRKIVKQSSQIYSFSIGWLFFQFGKAIFK